MPWLMILRGCVRFRLPRSAGTHIVGSWAIDRIYLYRDPRTGTQYIGNWASRVSPVGTFGIYGIGYQAIQIGCHKEFLFLGPEGRRSMHP